MNGFAGTRVIIVDDEESEALPVLKEFSRRGIATVYFDSTRRALPTKAKRLLGVRLAILDMDLVGGGVATKSKMSTLMNYIKGILHPNNGPFGVIVWTGNAYLLPDFESSIFVDKDIPNPIFTIGIDKQDCRVKGKFRLDILSNKIDAALANFSPLLLMQEWEEKCFIAATAVTNGLAELASQNAPNLADWRTNWKLQFLQLMRAMASAEAGQQLAIDSVLNSLYESMNPLLADRMGTNTVSLRSTFSKHSTDILAAQQNISLHSKAKLNTMLHLAFDGVEGFYAGNIYLRSKLSTQVPTVTKLLNDFVAGGINSRIQNLSNVRPLSKSIVIETNPFCDHSQNNIRIARFIAGLIVPENKSEKIKKAEFIYKLGPVFLEARWLPAGEYSFYFSARHLLTMELGQVKNIAPIARLRGQAFGDLQSWFSRQATRPGMLVL